jgi:hypothetical protein
MDKSESILNTHMMVNKNKLRNLNHGYYEYERMSKYQQS